jgi:riboflavin synthase
MFTGIVEERAAVTSMDGHRLSVAARQVREDGTPGASIAVNGVCLTVVERDGDELRFDLADETLARTTLASVRPGHHVNLERPVTPLTRLGGHIVQGHVDGVGTVRAVEPAEGGAVMRIEAPPGLGRYLVEKGSVAVDGVSLTVAAVADASFDVALIPHTLEVTTLGERAPGDAVNLEVDILAKYVERIVGRNR